MYKPSKRDLRPQLGDFYRLWLFRRRGERPDAPCCRRCAYPVKGLDRPRCPECGADLKRHGVLNPTVIRKVARILRKVSLCSILVFAAIPFLPTFTDWVGPQYAERHAEWRWGLTPNVPLAIHGENRGIVWHPINNSDGLRVNLVDVVLDDHYLQPGMIITIDLDSEQIRSFHSRNDLNIDDRLGKDFDESISPESLGELLKAANYGFLNIDPAALSSALIHLKDHPNLPEIEVIKGGFMTDAGRSVSAAHPVWQVLVLLGWSGIWILLLVWIIRGEMKPRKVEKSEPEEEIGALPNA